MTRPKPAAALRAAVQWVLKPTDPNRRAAGEAGKAATFSTPAGCIAMSVFWTGENIDPMLPANLLSGTIVAAAAEGSPENMKENLHRFVALGISIAKGKYPWKVPDDQ